MRMDLVEARGVLARGDVHILMGADILTYYRARLVL